MQMFEKISNPAAAIWNSISDTHYGYICVSATFQGNMASSNQDNLNIIWDQISKEVLNPKSEFEYLIRPSHK